MQEGSCTTLDEVVAVDSKVTSNTKTFGDWETLKVASSGPATSSRPAMQSRLLTLFSL